MTFKTAATPMTREGYLTARWTFRAFRSELAVHCNDWSIGYRSRETLDVQGGGMFRPTSDKNRRDSTRITSNDDTCNDTKQLSRLEGRGSYFRA